MEVGLLRGEILRCGFGSELVRDLFEVRLDVISVLLCGDWDEVCAVFVFGWMPRLFELWNCVFVWTFVSLK